MENKFTSTQNKTSNIEKDSMALEIKQQGLRDLLHTAVRTADNIYVLINGAYSFFTVSFDDFSSEVCELENILDEAICRAYKLFWYLDPDPETDTISPEELFVLLRPKRLLKTSDPPMMTLSALMNRCIALANELLTVVEGIYNIIFPSKPSEKDYQITLDDSMSMVPIIEQIQWILDDIDRVMHDIHGGL